MDATSQWQGLKLACGVDLRWVSSPRGLLMPLLSDASSYWKTEADSLTHIAYKQAQHLVGIGRFQSH